MLIFFFNDTATTEIYTLSLHDALPIFLRKKRQLPSVLALVEGDHVGQRLHRRAGRELGQVFVQAGLQLVQQQDRKSTRLNSSHLVISYAVFCLKIKHTIFCCTVTSSAL